jgi:hypothetical protein
MTSPHAILLDRLASIVSQLRTGADLLQKVIDTFPPDGDVDKLFEHYVKFCQTIERAVAISRTHAPVRPEEMS